jgi:tetratricopeptide (TPR) repeat protein
MHVRIKAIMGVLQALAGDADGARATLDDVGVALASPGFWGAEAPRMAATAEIVLGNLDAAERSLRHTSEQFEDPLLRLDGGGLFAYLLALEGRMDEALTASEAAEALRPRRNIDDNYMWRTARALAYSAIGRHDAAEALAREAVALTLATDGLRWQGNALMGLARVLAPVDPDGAHAAAAQAIEKYDAKGAFVLAAAAETFVKGL